MLPWVRRVFPGRRLAAFQSAASLSAFWRKRAGMTHTALEQQAGIARALLAETDLDHGH
jgi:hypothetical protein